MDFVSVVLIEAAVEGEEGDPIHLHVNFEVTAAGSEDAASALLEELIAQADDPNSRLLQGSVTASVEHAGEARGNLNPGCEPVFLGPDIGFVNIMVRRTPLMFMLPPRCAERHMLAPQEYHDEDGSCTISMAELATTCSAFFAQCLAFLNSSGR